MQLHALVPVEFVFVGKVAEGTRSIFWLLLSRCYFEVLKDKMNVYLFLFGESGFSVVDNVPVFLHHQMKEIIEFWN